MARMDSEDEALTRICMLVDEFDAQFSSSPSDDEQPIGCNNGDSESASWAFGGPERRWVDITDLEESLCASPRGTLFRRFEHRVRDFLGHSCPELADTLRDTIKACPFGLNFAIHIDCICED